MMRVCAFLTLEDREGFFIYDHLLREPLASYGWSVDEIPWTRANVDWAKYDAVIIRSTWDYQKSPKTFLETLAEIESRTRLFNPLEICRWNLNKRYLLDLQSKGVRIVPTDWLHGLKEDTIETHFESSGVSRLVAKPLIGANADDTFVLQSGDNSSWNNAVDVLGNRELMLQPFLESISEEGEYSLFYLGGHFSHAIVKRPAKGDFRVQEEHGGSFHSTAPADDILQLGKQTIDALEQTLLYARVDVVRLESGEPALIEIELIEPSLYFEECAESTT
ncbi:MAG: hypothetical protein AAF394_13190, partial [Planctomycetota bacterium]